MPNTPYTRQSPEQRELGRLRAYRDLLDLKGKWHGKTLLVLIADIIDTEKRIAELEKNYAPETVPPNG